MKRKDLKKAYGEVPQSFHNTVVRTLNTLESREISVRNDLQTQSFGDFEGSRISIVQTKKRRVLRTAALCALIVAVGTVGAISAKAIYPMAASKEGNYGLNIELEPTAVGTGGQLEANEKSESDLSKMNLSLDSSKNAPEYVKMNIGYLPEGVVGDGVKYGLEGSDSMEKSFTFVRDRVVEKKTFTDLNVVDYEEFDINGNKAILANVAVEPFSKRFYIYFEDKAAFIETYVTSDVSDEEVKKVMENITVEECTEEEANFDSLTHAKEVLKEEKQQEFYDNLYGLFEHEDVYDYSEVKLGQKITYGGNHESHGLELTFDKIEVLDNISDLDYNSFDEYYAEEYLPIYTDENGNFIPHEREWYISGDGITAPFNQVSRTDTVTTKMIYVTLTVNNPTDKSIPFLFQGFEKMSALYDTLSEDGNEEYPRHLSNEVKYIDNNNVDRDGFQHGFNFLDVPANSTETIHIGFFVDEDMIDETYVTLDECWCDSSVFDPKKSEFVDNNKDYYHNLACVKVE